MHRTVMEFVTLVLSSDDVRDKRVLEVGSCAVYGSVRPVVERLGPASYLGIDMREGPGVDRVLGASELLKTFGSDMFDLIVCAEVLEHAQDWRAVINNMKGVLRSGGVLVLTTRSWGFPLHEYPGDFWRFEVGDLCRIFGDFDILEAQPDRLIPGAFISARKIGGNGRVDLDNIYPRSMQQV